MEYKPVQKKNSSWTPTTVQKKGKSSAQQGRFSIQPKTNPSSVPSQEIGDYSKASADRLAANAMRGIQAKEQEQAETPTVQRQSESVGLSSGFDVAPPTTLPPTPKMGTGFPSVSETQIQRQCADCAFEQQEQVGEAGKDLKENGIQTKLTIGAPGDPYEQEADQVAAQVMSMPAPPDSSASVQRRLEANNPNQIWQRAQSIKPVVQRRIDEQVQMQELVQRAVQMGGNQASGDLESRLNASKGGGSPLSEPVRRFMEPRFGADFSSVRVHTGGDAVQMNRELGAQAFTHGSDVYFGAGKSPGNNELTAHELTHVVQQTGVVQRKNKQEQIQPSLLHGIAPKSQVLGHLQAMQEQLNIDGALYFGNAFILEIPGPATSISGYFKSYPSADLYHHPHPDFVPIAEDNTLGTARDQAAFSGNPAPWKKGGFKWDIPNHFRVKGEGGNGKKFTTVTQAFSISGSDGTSKVTKAGESVERTP